jgi:hypothetical protein
MFLNVQGEFLKLISVFGLLMLACGGAAAGPVDYIISFTTTSGGYTPAGSFTWDGANLTNLVLSFDGSTPGFLGYNSASCPSLSGLTDIGDFLVSCGGSGDSWSEPALIQYQSCGDNCYQMRTRNLLDASFTDAFADTSDALVSDWSFWSGQITGTLPDSPGGASGTWTVSATDATSTPEPVSFGLAATGLGLLAVMRRSVHYNRCTGERHCRNSRL